MSKRSYYPERGDLVEMNFQPAAGKEIDKRRPAVVLSPLEYNRKTGFCLAVPITSDMTPGPLWIPMPPGYLPRPSQILCDFVKSFDWRERSVSRLGSLPKPLVDEVAGLIYDLILPLE